jgi:hypothetical protein
MSPDVRSTLNYTYAIVGTSDLPNTRAVSVDRDDVISYGDVTENTDRLFVVPTIAHPTLSLGPGLPSGSPLSLDRRWMFLKRALTTAAHRRPLSPILAPLVMT